MNLEDIMLSKISQAWKDKNFIISYVESKKVDVIKVENRTVGTWD